MEATDIATAIDELACKASDAELVRRAGQLAVEAHLGQKRRSGEPYVTHPLAVAALVCDWGMDDATVCAALLHDVIEDTAVTADHIVAVLDAGDTGSAIARIVEGLTKLDGLKLVSGSGVDERQAAALQRLLVATAADARVLVAKIADRLHNVRTLQWLPEEKAKRIARETMDVYAPLAERLGMGHIAGELEDLCFAVLFPKRYAELQHQVAERVGEREQWLADVQQHLHGALGDAGIDASVSGRAKRLWSVYEKMVHKNRTLDQVYDLVGIRIIVGDLAACYGALGVVHQRYAPVPGRFKDWIATPKWHNLYQSLHTTVISDTGAPVEVQIRTAEMHESAEWGVAAHWRYKQGVLAPGDQVRPPWMERLAGMSEDKAAEVLDAQAFMEHLAHDLGRDEIVCFTPLGDAVVLPERATPVDFAYAVHTDVGHHCVGAKVNGRMVALSSTLSAGDRVEILTGRNARPNRDWLGFVSSGRARGRIRQWFARERRVNNSEAGRVALSRALSDAGVPSRLVRFDGLDDVARSMGYASASVLLGDIGGGVVLAGAVARKMLPSLTGGAQVQQGPDQRRAQLDNSADLAAEAAPVVVEGATGVAVRLAGCCNPRTGDAIVGYVTGAQAGRKVSVHRVGCIESVRLAQERRSVEVAWRGDAEGVPVSIVVEALDRPGLLSDVARAITETGAIIISSSTAVGRDMVSRERFAVAVADVRAVDEILAKVNDVTGVFATSAENL